MAQQGSTSYDPKAVRSGITQSSEVNRREPVRQSFERSAHDQARKAAQLPNIGENIRAYDDIKKTAGGKPFDFNKDLVFAVATCGISFVSGWVSYIAANWAAAQQAQRGMAGFGDLDF